MIRAAVFVLASCGGAVACDVQGVRLASDVDDAPKAFVALTDVPLAQPFSLQIKVCDPVAQGGVQVDAFMPAHQHGMNYVPQVSGLGDGVFQVEGMLFHMPGVWEMRVTVDFDGTSVPYTHSITLQ